MAPRSNGPNRVALRPRLLFVLSAAGAAVALQVAWYEPLAGIACLAIIAVLVGGRWLSRRRARRLLQSGDVESVLRRWSDSFSQIPYPETMGPLMTATAFVAYGWVLRAREVLRTAERGPAWEAAIEHRLFLDSLLLTFEGDTDEALRTALALQQLPLPDATPLLIERLHVLRNAVAALARAFSHRSRDGDRTLLIEASDTSPLVHWAMRYGAAIVAVDDGQLAQARALLEDAPEWPVESCFHGFHAEIGAELGRLELGRLELSRHEQDSATPPRPSSPPPVA
jgi:hypothetical protein